ncbi:unnamed protein product [Cunninghamella blakesleeana]
MKTNTIATSSVTNKIPNTNTSNNTSMLVSSFIPLNINNSNANINYRHSNINTNTARPSNIQLNSNLNKHPSTHTLTQSNISTYLNVNTPSRRTVPKADTPPPPPPPPLDEYYDTSPPPPPPPPLNTFHENNIDNQERNDLQTSVFFPALSRIPNKPIDQPSPSYSSLLSSAKKDDRITQNLILNPISVRGIRESIQLPNPIDMNDNDNDNDDNDNDDDDDDNDDDNDNDDNDDNDDDNDDNDRNNDDKRVKVETSDIEMENSYSDSDNDSFTTAREFSEDEDEDKLRFSDRPGIKVGPKSALKKKKLQAHISDLEFLHDQEKSSSTTKRSRKPYLNIINNTIESSSKSPTGTTRLSDTLNAPDTNRKRKRSAKNGKNRFKDPQLPIPVLSTSYNSLPLPLSQQRFEQSMTSDPSNKSLQSNIPILASSSPISALTPTSSVSASTSLTPALTSFTSNAIAPLTTSNLLNNNPPPLTSPTNQSPTIKNFLDKLNSNNNSDHESPYEMAIDLLPDGNSLSTFIDDICDLVSIRAIDSVTTDDTLDFEILDRPMPRLKRLFLVGNFTILLDSIRTIEETREPLHNDVQEHNIYYESVLAWVIRNGADSVFYLPDGLKKDLKKVINMLPIKFCHEFIDNDHVALTLRDFKIQDAFNRVRSIIERKGRGYEIFWIIYLELGICAFGPSRNLLSVTQHCFDQFPNSLDMCWLIIRTCSGYKKRKALILEYLEHLSNKRSALQESTSATTTELLLRVHRFYGLREMLLLFLGKDASTGLKSYEIIEKLKFNSFPRYIYLTDTDSYFLWMNVLYYLTCNKMLPDSIRRNWCSRWQTTQVPSLDDIQQHLFTIDWSILAAVPLTSNEQRIIVSLLLKLVKYFSEKARSNVKKRPLFMAIWRTLIECQLGLSCYGDTGVLILLKSSNSMTIKSLQPEIIDICLELEYKLANDNAEQLWLKIQQEQLSDIGSPQQKLNKLSQGLYLAFRSAIIMKPSFSTPVNQLMTIAWRVARPLWLIVNRATSEKLTRVKQNTDQIIHIKSNEDDLFQQQTKYIEAINYIYGMYRSALGLDDAFSILLLPEFNPNDFQKLAFAWINTILITLIRNWLLNDPQSLTEMLEVTITACQRCIRSESDVKLIFKYVEACKSLASEHTINNNDPFSTLIDDYIQTQDIVKYD